MYVSKPKSKTCLNYVLDIAHDSTNRDSRTYKLQKREVNFSEVQPIEIKFRPIEIKLRQIKNCS